MFLKRLLHTTVVTVSILALFTMSHVAQAGPVGLLFRVVRGAIPHPEHGSRWHGNSHTRYEEPVRDGSHSEVSNSPLPAPPNENNVRKATSGQSGKQPDKKLPYGIPVPGKQGLVTSPFSESSGYIDVRGIAPGTEVRDPYTGDIFLAP